MPPDPGPTDTSPTKHLRSALGQDPSEPLDQIRVVELAGLLAELVVSLDQVAWSTWKAVAPASGIRRSAPLRDTLAKFASGDESIQPAQVKADLDRLRQLAAGLLAATNQGTRQFAQKHVQKFAPAEIEGAAKMSGGGLLASADAKAWRKYVELAGPLDADALHKDITATIASYAESLLRSLSR